jgi:predicted secreted protein
MALGLAAEVANADFTFGEPVNLGPPFDTPSSGGGFSISTDGLEVYISLDRPGGLGYIDMWRSTRENADDPWGPLVNVQEINSRYSEAYPCLSGDGLTLYFSDWYDWNAAGDRPGGVGHHDLWMCTRPSTGDPWGAPVNMGAIVNSPNAEILPFVSRDGQILIFASKNRSGGLGNYDLWMSTRPAAEGDWTPPVNMGPAVNSSAYDGDGCLSTDGLALFFCSNRPGGRGSYDMWMTTRRSQAAAWSPPVNLGPAINTSGGEGVPSLSPDQRTLYFGSGTGGSGLMYEVSIVAMLDFNVDGIVDSADMCIMVDNWHTENSLCDVAPAPLGDGFVDVQDLIVLAEHLFEPFPPVEPAEVNEDDDGGRVKLQLGQILVVTLESNPTTGYRWEQAENAESVLRQIGEAEFKPSETGDPPLVGAGGWEILRFRASSAGQMTLQLVYHRPWEEGVEPLKTFSLQIIVR